MNQSSFIAAMLLAAFVFFLAAKNRLSSYTSVVWGGAPTSGTSAASAIPAGATPLNQSLFPGGYLSGPAQWLYKFVGGK